MAYDQHSTYEPPRRPYQTHAPAPVQHSYNDYADYASTPFDRQEQYDQRAPAPGSHQQQYGGYGQDYGAGGSAGYDNGYEHAHGRTHDYEQRYDQQYAQPQDRQDRHYDPRYQPRAQHQQQHHQRPPPSGYPAGPDLRAHSKPESYDPRSNGDAAPGGGYSNTPKTYSGHAQAASKSSIEEWKAQEKARLQAGARSPATLPFDNAFPVFGEQKKARSSSRGAVARGQRELEHRPKTSGGHRPRGSRETNNYDAGHQGRPTQSQPPAQAPANQFGSPIDQHFDFGLGQEAPPPSDGYQSNGYSQPAPEPHAHAGHVDRAVPGQLGPGSVPPLDTSQSQYHQGPVYNTSQPLSPTYIPPRPATAQGPRSQATCQPPVPLSEPQSATFHNDYPGLPQKPFAREDSSRPASLGDIIDDYGAEPAPKPLQRRPTTREEEIEADMPDFDSAAPAQTSHLQKRLQANNASSGPAAHHGPPASYAGLPQSSSAPDIRHPNRQDQYDRPLPSGLPRHNDYNGGASSVPPPQPMGSMQDSRTRPGLPNGMQPPQAPFAHEPTVRRSLDDGQPMPYRNGPPPSQRFNAQGRLLPQGPPNGMRGGPMGMRGGPGGMRGGPNSMRGGPNGMRGAPNGMRGRGGPNGMPMGRGQPPRPDMDRQDTAWSDPGMHRTGSAPARGPPRGMEGAPLSQQRSAPDQAPPPSNPDALPQHPVPVRPGLMENNGQGQPVKPPPVRNYGTAQPGPPQNSTAPHQRQASIDDFAQPVTSADLQRLRSTVDGRPDDAKLALILVKKLVEASTTLAAEGGRADPKTTAKNRERYVLEADKRLRKLVNGGYADAQFYLADCYGSGALGLEFDAKEAFKLYQSAAKAGHAEAAYRTAVCCEIGAEEGGGTGRDYAKAVQWYRRAATLGDGPGMYKLGAILLKGLLGQQRNIVEAVIWLKRAAEKADAENPHALHELAQLYESENTNPEIRNKVVADDSYARELFQKAADLGYKSSQFRLGQAYEYGALGCTIDNRMSIAYYTKAAAQGEHQAELALSGWYLTGAPGILENSDTEAYLWARKAASSEPPLAKAMFAMGYFTENGIGCPQSMEEARKWYSRAASYKFPKAIERLEELKRGGSKKDKGSSQNGKLSRKDQKRDEENCVVM